MAVESSPPQPAKAAAVAAASGRTRRLSVFAFTRASKASHTHAPPKRSKELRKSGPPRSATSQDARSALQASTGKVAYTPKPLTVPMLPTHYRKFLAALIIALIGVLTASAPLVVAASGTSQAPPPPVQMALIPRASRLRRIRRYLSVRCITMRLLGRRLEAPADQGVHRPAVARRRPNCESYPRGPPCHPTSGGQPTGRPTCRPVVVRRPLDRPRLRTPA